MNTVQLVGRLTRDVELRFTSSGTAVGSLPLRLTVILLTNKVNVKRTSFRV